MKIAVSSSGNDLNAMLDPRFGRCAYFLIIDPDSMRFEAFDNLGAIQSGGAGIQAAQFVADKQVTAVITGHVGPNAVKTLTAAGIDVFTGQQGTISEVLERFKKGILNPTTQSTVQSHFGMGGGTGSRRGGGMGMGQGRGMGRSGGVPPGQYSGRGSGMGRGGGMRR